MNCINLDQSDDPYWLRYAFFGCVEQNWTDPHWEASPADREIVKQAVPVDSNIYWCLEHSEDVVAHDAMLVIAPFSCGSMWQDCRITWKEIDLSHGWGRFMSKRIVTYLRHVAPLWNNHHNETIPMDWGG